MIQQCTFRTPVYVKNRTANGDHGEPTMGTAATVLSMVDERAVTVRTSDGQEIRARATIYMPAGTTVSDGARLSLDGSVYYDVIDVRKARRRNGQTNHLEVFI